MAQDQEQDEVAVIEAEQEGTEQEAAPEAAPAAEPDEVVVTIGDEKPPEEAPAPEWVKQLREDQRELKRRNKELEDALRAREAPAAAGKKPALEDFDYDAEKFESALLAWTEVKRQADAKAAQEQAEQAAEQAAFQAKRSAYEAAKAALKVKDYADAEDAVRAVLTPAQQGILVKYAKSPELVVYAMGKNMAKLRELAAIADPLEFGIAMRELEGKLKVTKREAPPPPERMAAAGTAPKSGVVDGALERLREEAAKTGDLSKVIAYKRSKAQQKSA